MKGKSTFTLLQIETIKKLIAKKVIATPDKQKGLRQQIRNIGFYYSDFSTRKGGYSIADFEALILSQKIIVGNELFDLIRKHQTNIRLSHWG